MLQAYPRHSLSRAALVTAGAPIFLLDTFTSLILYYTPGYPASIPFPPPHSSLLRKTVQAVKQSRQISPQLKMFRGQQLLVPCRPTPLVVPADKLLVVLDCLYNRF
jgi:hypothetical protein